MRSPPITPPSLWNGPTLTLLNLAAFVTWLAVLLDAPRWSRVFEGDPLQIGGALALIGIAIGYVLVTIGDGSDAKRPSRQRAFVIAQALGVLLATWCLRNGGAAVLLIIVAAQAVAMWNTRQTVIGMLVLNLMMIAIWMQGISFGSALISMLPLIGFQTFAGLTVHYAATAERARDQLALTHAELLTTQSLLEASARSGERLRLSRELHDVAGHKLTALKINLVLLQRDPRLADREEVRVAATLADELLDDIRAVVSELRKGDGIELDSAIRALTQQIPGTRFSIDMDPALRLTSLDSAEILLRCAQEGITNALRHARASEIQIRCEQRGELVELRIRDDGRGVKSAAFGNGLNGMRERLHAVGGHLTLRARAEGGSELLASLPLHA